MGYLPVGDCFPSIFHHHNVPIKDSVNKIDVSLAAESSWSSVNEIKIYIGKDNPTYVPYDLLQDSARTWVIFDDDSDMIEVSELQLNGNGNLAFANNGSAMKFFTAGKLVGDHTGTLHIGPKQSVSINSAPNSIMATSVFAYQVCHLFEIVRKKMGNTLLLHVKRILPCYGPPCFLHLSEFEIVGDGLNCRWKKLGLQRYVSHDKVFQCTTRVQRY